MTGPDDDQPTCGCPDVCYLHRRWGRLFDNAFPLDGTPDPPLRRPEIWEQNARIFAHEAATPMRGHDEDGECCRRAKFGVPPACPRCGHDQTGDPSRKADGDHLVILESPPDFTTTGELQRTTVRITVTQKIRFAWCSTIDRSTLP